MQPFCPLLRGWIVDDEDIYRKNRDDLIRHATVLVGPADADDVVSTVVLRVLARQRLGDLDEPRPYLFRPVLNDQEHFSGGDGHR